MSGRDELVSEELAALLNAEKPVPEVSREARDRMLSKLDAALVIAAAATVATTAHVVREAAQTAATTAVTAAASGAATQEAVVNTAASGAAGGGLSLLARLFATKVPFGVVMFALGGVSGVAVAPKIMKPRVVMVPAPVRAPEIAHPRFSAPVPVPAPVTPEPVVAPPVVAPPVIEPTHARPPVARVDDGPLQQAIRSRLDRAEVAIREGQTDAAREALMELDAPRFHNAEADEERECLWVSLLAKEGRRVEARARAERFHQRFPNSLFTARVNSEIARLPAP